MNKFESINAFIEVVEKNSFAAAARKLNQSTAAISRKISNLEEDLGVQLLKRTTRKLSLTEVGMHYYDRCKKTLQELEGAENAINAGKDEAEGILSVVSNRHFAMNIIIPRLPEFLALNPKLRVKLEVAERFPDFEKEEVDLLYGVSLDGPDNLVRRQIAITQFLLCATPAYLKKFGVPKTPADLTKHRIIVHSGRNPDNMIPFKDEKEFYFEPYLYVNDNAAMLKCALKDMGITYTHCYKVKDELKEGKLVELLADYKLPKKPTYLYYKQNRYLQPKIRRFIDFYMGDKKPEILTALCG